MEHQDQHPLFLTASEYSLAFNLLVCTFQRWHWLHMPRQERDLQGHQQAGKYMRLGKIPNCAKGPQIVPKDIFLLVVPGFRRQYNNVVGQKTFKNIIGCQFEIGKSNKPAQFEGIFRCGRWLFWKVLWQVKLGKQEFLASGRLQDDVAVVLSKCQTDKKNKRNQPGVKCCKVFCLGAKVANQRWKNILWIGWPCLSFLLNALNCLV